MEEEPSGSIVEDVALIWIMANRKGQSLVEYALILLLVAISAVLGMTVLGGGLVDIYGKIVSEFPWV